ncbi:hypothetical protein [Burkholderia multivorans]|uniref:hypothetical protein n=1 Tax=Burkholderia multivorans TaxID=87883 RepID=UPI001E4ABDDD|nr:hypothetical protein [Burkholderia multivorans]
MPFLAPQVRHRRVARNTGRASTKTIGALSDAAQFVPRLISFMDGNSKTALQRSCAGTDGLRVRRKRALIARFVLPGKAMALAETSLSKGAGPRVDCGIRFSRAAHRRTRRALRSGNATIAAIATRHALPPCRAARRIVDCRYRTARLEWLGRLLMAPSHECHDDKLLSD